MEHEIKQDLSYDEAMDHAKRLGSRVSRPSIFKRGGFVITAKNEESPDEMLLVKTDSTVGYTPSEQDQAANDWFICVRNDAPTKIDFLEEAEITEPSEEEIEQEKKQVEEERIANEKLSQANTLNQDKQEVPSSVAPLKTDTKETVIVNTNKPKEETPNGTV